MLKHEVFYLQIGSSIACGTGVNLSKFYYYEPESDTCLAEIGCPVPLDDTSRGNRCVIKKNILKKLLWTKKINLFAHRFFSKISCLHLCQRKKSTTIKTSNDEGGFQVKLCFICFFSIYHKIQHFNHTCCKKGHYLGTYQSKMVKFFF